MNTITVYTTATCGYCHMLINYLNLNKIPFTEKRVDTDQEAAKEMVELSGQMGVPFTIFDKNGKKEGVLGFDVQRIQQLIVSK